MQHQQQHSHLRHHQPLVIEPSRSLGPFLLGSSINEVIAIVQRESVLYRENLLTFDQHDPLSRDIVLDLLDLSLRLRFSSSTQRLTLIDCYSPSTLTFRYHHTTFSGPSHPPPSLSSIYQTIGPTYPPSYHSPYQSYILQYPGLCFAFHSPPDPSLPIQTSDFDSMDHTHTQLSRLFIHYGSLISSPSPPSLPLPSPPIPSLLYPNHGIHLPSLSLTLTFTTHIQSLLIDLGPPSTITPSHDHTMRIHAPHPDPSPPSDLFFNYYHLGLDVLVEGRGGRVRKVVVHGNVPGGREFGLYRKTEWKLMVGNGGEGVGCDVRWEEMERRVKEAGGEVSRGMLNGGGEKGMNPFGSTMFYATRGVIFEVLPKSSMIQTVTLFYDP